MWLISHRNLYDHAWILEDDVYWTDMAQLGAFFDLFQNDMTDFLHQNRGMENHPIQHDSKESHWWNLDFLRVPKVQTVQAQLGPPYYHGLFMMYRMSSRMATALDQWRLRNSGEWTFFEPLLSTLPLQHHRLVTKAFIDNAANLDFHLDYRPCFTHQDIYGEQSRFPNGGCFHPVKKNFTSCSA